jgi:hypothetical protein
MRTRYGITKPAGRSRVLIGSLYDHSSDAAKHLTAMLANNSKTRLREVYGTDPRHFAVRPFECWDNGQATGIYAANERPAMPREASHA